MTRIAHPRTASLLSLAVLACSMPFSALAQARGESGGNDQSTILTQTLIRADSRDNAVPTLPTTSLLINNKPAQLRSLDPVPPSGTQVAILLDDGLRRSASIQFEDIRKFLNGLPAGTEVMLGFMANGRVETAAPFTTDHAAVAAGLRMPEGIAGISASPYFCLSDFVKHWPGNDENQAAGPSTATKARFVLMITNGVDPYNGSTSIMNQDSPYVQAAVTDAQRAGVAVSSIYYGDAGIRGGSANFSGQSYLRQLSDATGGEAYYEGSGNPVSFQPFLRSFQAAINQTYVATFDANPKGEGREQLVRLKVNTSVPKLKLRHAEQVRPGNHEAPITGPANAGAANLQ